MEGEGIFTVLELESCRKDQRTWVGKRSTLNARPFSGH
jgi:hypothetical protein